MKKYDVFFNGVLTTVTPVSYTTPDLDKIQIKEPGQLPKMSGRLYVPASALRGKLRRMARDIVREGLSTADNDYLFPLADFYLNTLGGVKGGGKDDAEGKELVARIRRVREFNPLVSLFGAMAPATVSGKLSVGHAIDAGQVPASPMLVQHMRTDDLARSADNWDMVQANAAAEYDALKSGALARSDLKVRIEEKKKLLRTADDEQKKLIRDEIKKLEEDLKSLRSVSVQLPNLKYEAIPAGVDLTSDFRLMGVTEAEIALFVKALNLFACNPVIGGRLNHGLGVVSGKWSVMSRITGMSNMETAGSVSIAGDFMPAAMTGQVDAWLNMTLPWAEYNFSADLFKEKEAA